MYSNPKNFWGRALAFRSSGLRKPMKRPAATRKKTKKRPASAARTKRWHENALKRKDAEAL